MSLYGPDGIFDPLLSLQQLHKNLRTKIKQKQVDSNTPFEVIAGLQDIYTNIFEAINCEDLYLRKQTILFFYEKMGYIFPVHQINIEEAKQILQFIANEMLLALAEVSNCKDMTIKLEPVYFELQRLIKDNTVQMFKKFQGLETEIYETLAKEIKPYLEDIFLRILPEIHIYSVPPNPVTVKYYFSPSRHREFKNLTNYKETISTISRFANQPLDLLELTSTQNAVIQRELETLKEESQKLELINELYDKFIDNFLEKVKSSDLATITEFHSYYCLIRFCFALAEEANKTTKTVTNIQDKINNLIYSPTLNKKTTVAGKKKSKNKGGKKAKNRRLGKKSAEEVLTENSLADEPSVDVSPSGSSEEEITEVLKNVSLSDPSALPPARQSSETTPEVDASLAAPQAILPAFNNHVKQGVSSSKKDKVLAVESELHPTKVNKVLELIFDNSPKLRYTKLIKLVESRLAGNVNTSTASSLNKFAFSGEKLNTHNRHGRDRKQFADVNVVKKFKEILINLGMVPNGYRDEHNQTRNLKQEKNASNKSKFSPN